MATDLVASRLIVRKAAKMIDIDVFLFFNQNNNFHQHPERTMYSAMAKRFATDKCFEVIFLQNIRAYLILDS